MCHFNFFFVVVVVLINEGVICDLCERIHSWYQVHLYSSDFVGLLTFLYQSLYETRKNPRKKISPISMVDIGKVALKVLPTFVFSRILRSIRGEVL